MAYDATAPDPRPSLLWIPGLGPDAGALDRLIAAFPKPQEPMGEAWFMSDSRRMYDELLGDLYDVEPDVLFDALEQIASGPPCFGPHEEWTEWLHYLLPRLVPGSHAGPIWTTGLQALATAFFARHPHSMGAEPYAGFRRDILATLGRALMDEECWPEGRIDISECLRKCYMLGAGRWFWDEPSGQLSVALFLCLKYLQPAEIAPWLTSVCAIDSAHWRAQVLAWFVGAHPFLTGALNQPGDEPDDAWPSIGWWGSNWLKGTYTGDFSGAHAQAVFIPPENRDAAIAAVRASISESTLLAWADAFATDPVLEEETGMLPDLFIKLYEPA